MQVYWNICERACRVASGQIEYEDDKPSSARNKKKKKKPRRRPTRLQDDGGDEGAAVEEEQEPEMVRFNRQAPNADDEEPHASDEERAASEALSGPKVEFFIEAVLNANVNKDNYESLIDCVVDYRFWFVSYSPSVDLNAIHAKAIKRAITYNEQIAIGAIKRPRSQQSLELKPWEKWKLIKERTAVSRLLEFGSRIRNTAKRGEDINSLPLEDPKNPISAIRMFSPVFLFAGLDEKAHSIQRKVRATLMTISF
jgi:hypothetical protein